MEETIDLQELFKILKKRLLLIVVLGMVSASISGVFTMFFVTPIYQTSTELVVSRADMDVAISNNEINANIQMINTFNHIARSPAILDQVVERLSLEGETGRSLAGRVDSRNATNSQVMVVTVRHEDPIVAYEIANMTATVLTQEIPDLVNFDNIRILAPAHIPSSPVSPNILMNVALGLVVGAMSGIFLAFLLDFLDKTVKTEEEIVALIGLPVLGTIQLITAKDMRIVQIKNDLAGRLDE